MISTRAKTEENHILFVKNLSYTVNADDLYGLFGKYGAVRQIRLGNTQATRGTAYVVYENPADAKAAHDSLGGFNFQGRYLVLLFHSVAKMNRSLDELEARKANLEKLKEDHGIE